MLKIIDPAGFDFDRPILMMMDVHRGGVDRGWFTKSAAVLTREIRDLRPEPGTTFLHALALGDYETTGGNRNGDIFRKRANVDHHKTFEKFAKFFKHHKNRPEKGDRVYGYVKHAAHNDEMGRVELVIGIYDKEAPDTIEKIAQGKDVPLSMSCSVPHDTCSICGHESKNTRDYCECLKKHAGKILDDGRFVGMFNDRPTFFDISEVTKPADRIAYGLRKVASGVQTPVFSADLAIQLGIQEPDLLLGDRASLRRTLEKLAAIERTMNGLSAEYREAASVLASPIGGLRKVACNGNDLRQTLSGLTSAKVSLSLADFIDLVMGDRAGEVEKDIPAAKAALPQIFNEMASDGCPSCDEYLPLDSALPPAIKDIVNSLVGRMGETGSPSSGRVMITIMKKKAVSSQTTRTPSGDFLAREYAKYKLANADRSGDPDFLLTMVLQNQGE